MKKKFPKGWSEERIRRVISFYENQTQDEAAAEDEAALQSETVIEVPKELLPAIREMIAKHQASRK
jgi:hypothetical protein